VDLRAGLDDVEKRKFLTLMGLELRPLSRPSRSQSLYRPCYPLDLQGLDKIMETLQILYIFLYLYGGEPPFIFNAAAIRLVMDLYKS
jgi:hypothetical protein